jgi:E3 ubiquitin-protein ligase HUWE1
LKSVALQLLCSEVILFQLLEELCVLGRDPKYVCWRAQNKMDVSPALASRPNGNTEGGSSDEEDEDEEEASTSSHPQREDAASDPSALHEKTPIALIDYILNVVRFLNF